MSPLTPNRTCLSITCPCLDENDGIVTKGKVTSQEICDNHVEQIRESRINLEVCCQSMQTTLKLFFNSDKYYYLLNHFMDFLT